MTYEYQLDNLHINHGRMNINYINQGRMNIN